MFIVDEKCFDLRPMRLLSWNEPLGLAKLTGSDCDCGTIWQIVPPTRLQTDLVVIPIIVATIILVILNPGMEPLHGV